MKLPNITSVHPKFFGKTITLAKKHNTFWYTFLKSFYKVDQRSPFPFYSNRQISFSSPIYDTQWLQRWLTIEAIKNCCVCNNPSYLPRTEGTLSEIAIIQWWKVIHSPKRHRERTTLYSCVIHTVSTCFMIFSPLFYIKMSCTHITGIALPR